MKIIKKHNKKEEYLSIEELKTLEERRSFVNSFSFFYLNGVFGRF